MPVSEKIGGLPFLSLIFDHGPLAAALIMLLADFAAIYFLMLLEGMSPRGVMPWSRSHYKTFVWNDIVFIPLYLYVATSLLERGPEQNGFYASSYWHWALFIAGVAASVCIEVGAVRNKQYTMRQELSPSKLWHTLIFGVVAYWILAALIPAIVVAYRTNDWFASILLLFAAVGFFYNMYRDGVLPFPRDAHLEGTYLPWDWYRRTY